MQLAKRMKTARLERGLSLEEIGVRIGKSAATVQRYESGEIKNIKYDLIESIAEVLEISPAYLMGWTTISGREIIHVPVIDSVDDRKLHFCGFREMIVTDDMTFAGNNYVVIANDMAMAPLIPLGAEVTVNVVDEIMNNDIVCIRDDDKDTLTFRRNITFNQADLLIPINPTSEVFMIDEDSNIVIIGKAIKVEKKL